MLLPLDNSAGWCMLMLVERSLPRSRHNREDTEMTHAETIAFHKLQLALEYARNHLVNPENTVMADLFADINEALALAEQVRPINA